MPVKGVYKVLIVDDSVTIVRAIQQIINNRPQFSAIVAYDAEEGVSLARAENPDVILLDINLPQMNGLKACRILKDMSPTTPIIVVTGEPDQALRTGAYESGADDFLQKPFTAEQIISHIRYHLHLSALDART